MSNLQVQFVHGSPNHDNIREVAVRDLLPGEIDYIAATGKVMIADAGAKTGREFAVINQDGSAVIKVPNPAYNPAGSTAITQNIGAKVYLDRTTPGSAWDVTTNPYEIIAYTNSASSLFLGTVADRAVRVTEEFIFIRFDNKAPVALGAAAT